MNKHGEEQQLCEVISRWKAAQAAKVSRRRRGAAPGPEQRGERGASWPGLRRLLAGVTRRNEALLSPVLPI